MANSGLFHGAHPERVDRQIRSSHLIPSRMKNTPMAPNLYLEAKGLDESAAVASRQACYDGAIGARGM